MTDPQNQPASVDLDDTIGCPTAATCEVCGGEYLLGVVPASCGLGVLCLTVCVTCLENDIAPAFHAVEVARRVGAHCTHLGIDLDQMADAMTASPQGAA